MLDVLTPILEDKQLVTNNYTQILTFLTKILTADAKFEQVVTLKKPIMNFLSGLNEFDFDEAKFLFGFINQLNKYFKLEFNFQKPHIGNDCLSIVLALIAARFNLLSSSTKNFFTLLPRKQTKIPLIPENALSVKPFSVLTGLKAIIKLISKNQLVNCIQMLENVAIFDINTVLRLWIGLKVSNKVIKSTKQNSKTIHLQQVDSPSEQSDLYTEDYSNSSFSGKYREIDGSIPAVCQSGKFFDIVLSDYLIDKIAENYWQYPPVLAKHIPFLLNFHIKEAVYMQLALKVYLACLEQIIVPARISNPERFTSFCEHSINAVQAIQYAWKGYIDGMVTKDDVGKMMYLWASTLHWPLFQLNLTTLIVVSPTTGQYQKFSAAKSALKTVVAFFKEKVSIIQDDEKTQKSKQISDTIPMELQT